MSSTESLADVLCFSGNGNSLAVARELRLGPVTTWAGRDTLTGREGGALVWVIPVHSWGLPLAVAAWMEQAPELMRRYTIHHLVLTCGDDCGLAARQWRRLIAGAGGRAGSASSVQMPNTYVLMPGFDTDSPEVADAKLRAMPARVAAIRQRILSGAADDAEVTVGSWPRLKSRLIYPAFMRWIRPRRFHTTLACIGCGECARACPLGNISITAGRPAWGSDCTLCLGCYNRCPRHAVAYGNATKHKGQWHLGH